MSGEPSTLLSGFGALALDDEAAIALAVSGGSDSTALLFLLLDHLAARGLSPKLLVLTVDHRLRPESGAEAERVVALCRRLHVEHRTLAWQGEKPRSGISDAARLARHRLLALAAREAGARLVLTGHTADDQAETFAMRAQRGEGPGLAGIAPATLFDRAVWFARPLIGARRGALREYLAARGEGWIDDPSNEDPARERARTRKAIGESGDVPALVASAAQAAEARRALSLRVAKAIGSHAAMAAPGLVRLDPTLFRDPAAAAEALRLVVACVGGLDRLPDLRRANGLAARIGAGERFRGAVGRCVVDVSAKGVFVHREWRGDGPKSAPALSGAVFDNRYAVLMSAGSGVVVAAGAGAPRGAGRLADAAARCEPVAPAGVTLRRIVSPFARFLPEFDLAAAKAAAALFGAELFPPSPWRGHIDGVA